MEDDLRGAGNPQLAVEHLLVLLDGATAALEDGRDFGGCFTGAEEVPHFGLPRGEGGGVGRRRAGLPHEQIVGGFPEHDVGAEEGGQVGPDYCRWESGAPAALQIVLRDPIEVD